MLQENEVVMVILGVGVFLFIGLNRLHIKRIYSWKILIWGYYILLAGWIFTVLEGFFLEYFLNLLEHICYAISAVMVVVWCWKSASGTKEEELQ